MANLKNGPLPRRQEIFAATKESVYSVGAGCRSMTAGSAPFMTKCNRQEEP